MSSEDQKFFHKDVINALQNSVMEICSLLRESEPQDLKEIIRRSDGGSTSKIIKYKGPNSSIQVRKIIEEKELCKEFLSALNKYHPEITGWIGTWNGGAALDQDSIVLNIAFQLYELSTADFSKEFNQIIQEIENCIISKKIGMSLKIPMSIWLNSQISGKISITSNLIFRPISDDEYEELFSKDIFFERRSNGNYGPLTMILEGSYEADINFSPSYESNIQELEKISTIYNWHEQAIQILHLFKEGNPQILEQTIKPKSQCLPIPKYRQMISGDAEFFSSYYLDSQEFIELEKLAQKIDKFYYKDSLLRWLLRFNSSARQNRQAELAFLFDIVEALETHFGGRSEMANSINVSITDITKISTLANNEIYQGRHKGKNFELIRDANPEELDSARAIAKKLIIGYLNYLEK